MSMPPKRSATRAAIRSVLSRLETSHSTWKAPPPAARPARRRLYIGGRWVEGSGGRDVAVINPATEQEIARVPEGSAADVEAAILAARRAFDEGPWGRTTAAERAVSLRRFVERL